jgi:succinate dehydrogenase/fumarate reductase cytochrome b subunit
MSTIRYSDAASNAMLDTGLVDYINTGAGAPEIEFYNSTMPATGDTAIAAQVLLATLTCSDPWEAGAAASRSVAADTITGANAVADGTATFAILYNGNGDRVALMDVGNLSSSAAIKMSSTAFVTGQPVSLTSLTISVPASLTG